MGKVGFPNNQIMNYIGQSIKILTALQNKKEGMGVGEAKKLQYYSHALCSQKDMGGGISGNPKM